MIPDDVRAWLKGLADRVRTDSDTPEDVHALIHLLKERSTSAQTPEDLHRLSAALDQMQKILTKSSEEMNEWQAHTIHRRVGQLLQDEIKGRDRSLLAKALKELNQVESWGRKSGHSDVHNDTLWEMYICHFRMGTWAEAADALQGLRRNVEKRRAGIDDRLKRAGVGAKFPYLYPALCQTLLKAGRIKELLGAIEGAKGRAVADVMAQRAHQVIDEAEFAVPATRMGELMVQNKAHYMSFLVDDDNTLAVLVGKDGSLHASNQIPLGKDRIRSASEYVDPRSWGIREFIGAPLIKDMAEVLEPLVAWLDPHFRSGLIENGDHLCYSPDEHLHQFPLAYVRFRGEPLVRRLSISRTHGARALALILGRRVSRPPTFLSVEVPAHQDFKNEAMVRRLRTPSTWLASHLSGTTYRDEKATVEALCRADLSERVVHFATHGTFPAERGLPPGRLPQNPFTHSGLALAGADGLPDRGRVDRGEDYEKLLTPERVLVAQRESCAVKKGLDFTGSHVTLQGCVTGLAREGIGGDALGLDWALFQQGASSLLASHWNVSAELSTEFFLRFYRSWLERGSSRATAWRQTVLEMMSEQGALANPYAWAAFSLSGDWR